MFRYAQIDEIGNIISDSYLKSEIVSDNMIAITSDINLQGKKYNLETKNFEDYIAQVSETPKTIEERLENIELTQDLILLKVEGVIV